MKKILLIAIVIATILALFACAKKDTPSELTTSPYTTYEEALPYFDYVEDFYTWAMMDMGNLYQASQHGEKNDYEDKISQMGRFESRNSLHPKMRRASLSAFIRLEDMFSIDDEYMKVTEVEVAGSESYEYFLRDLRLYVAVVYRQEIPHHLQPLSDWPHFVRIDNLFIIIDLPSDFFVEAQERLSNEKYRPITDILSKDEKVREAAIERLAENVRKHVVYFDPFEGDNRFYDHNDDNCYTAH